MAFAALKTTPVGTPSLRAGLDRTMALVEATLARACPSSGEDSGTLQTALLHHLSAGGQRLRARLCAETALLLDLREPDAAALASCCELLHNASLVQGDLHRRDTTPRGQTAVWAAYGDSVAIALTDTLVSAGLASLADVSIPDSTAKLVRKAQDAVFETLAGQQAGLDSRDRPHRSVAEYLNAARAKTGPLMALVVELPLVANGLGGSLPRARQAACAFALAYQILDDVRDVEIDRTRSEAPGSVNIVLLLERLGARNPFADAVSLARGHLTLSRAAAGQLPSSSGTPLVQAAWTLDDALRQTSDD